MYAQLGSLMFETTGPLTGMSARRGYSFPEHEVIEGRPRLQFTGTELEERTLTLVFSEAFCDVARAAAELRAMADRHEAVPLLFADGTVLGHYVIQELAETVHETDPAGTPSRVSYRVRLLEWTETTSPVEVKKAPATAVKGSTAAKAKKTQPARPKTTNPRAVPVCVSSRSLCPTE